ncbi:unnamed protein product, partial [Rotaria sp. Silwood2]
FIENGSVENLARGGRPSTIFSEEKLEEIKKMIINNPSLSIRQGTAEAGISKSRYQVVKKQLYSKPYRPTLILGRNEDDFDRLSEFCEI